MWWSRRSGLRYKRRGASRARTFERLESRQLMAVSTALRGGWLTITGDTANDNIAIVGTANPGEFVVFGRDGTTVNGIANGNVTIPGVTGNLTVRLNGGDDVLSMDSVFVARIIHIDTGDGNDAVAVGARSVVSSAGNLTINTDAGNDQVAELSYAVFVGGAHAVDLGAGDDTATLVGVSAVGGTHGALHNAPPVPSISVRGRDGNDSLLAIGVTARLELRLDGEEGSNSVALLTSAADLISVTTTSGNLYLDTNYSVTHVAIF